MSRIKGRENRAEVLLRRELWARGLRYRLHVRYLCGKPDIVFARARLVVFIDGDFWHGRALVEGGEAALREVIRGPRYQWWEQKLAKNLRRDVAVTAGLKADGWTVVRVWETDLLRAVNATADAIEKRVRRRDL